MNKYFLTIAGLFLVIAGFLFYWKEIRVESIRKKCFREAEININDDTDEELSRKIVKNQICLRKNGLNGEDLK